MLFSYFCLLDFGRFKHLIRYFCWISSSKSWSKFEFELDIKLELGLTNKLSQAKPSSSLLAYHKLKLKQYFRLVSSSSQAWAFEFYRRAKLEHASLGKTQLVYSLTHGRRPEQNKVFRIAINSNQITVFL